MSSGFGVDSDRRQRVLTEPLCRPSESCGSHSGGIRPETVAESCIGRMPDPRVSPSVDAH